MQFFRNQRFIPSLNCTHITMILKVKGLTRLEDYRPISCVGVPYKIISRIITGRLMEIIPNLISANQTGFLRSRRINDNIGLAHEFLLGFNRKSVGKRAMITLDFRKAFDVVRETQSIRL